MKFAHFFLVSSLILKASADTCQGPCVHGLSTKSLNFTTREYHLQPCLCQAGFAGRHCDEPSFRCLNGGTPLSNGVCKCPEDREGTRCENERCYNGMSSRGLAWDSDSSGGPCICDVGYTGRHCELHLSSQCGAHGRLYVGREEEGCQCDEAYTGLNCERLKDCVNGVDEGGRCDCNEGWTGKRCDHIVCVYGKAASNRSACECDRDFIGGKHCDVCADFFEVPPQCGRSSKALFGTWLIVSILALFLLVIGVIAAVLITCHLQRRKKLYRSLDAKNDVPDQKSLTYEQLLLKYSQLQKRLESIEREKKAAPDCEILNEELESRLHEVLPLPHRGHGVNESGSPDTANRGGTSVAT